MLWKIVNQSEELPLNCKYINSSSIMKKKLKTYEYIFQLNTKRNENIFTVFLSGFSRCQIFFSNKLEISQIIFHVKTNC